MTIYNTAYETRACNGHQTSAVIESIKKSIINGTVRRVEGVVTVDSVGSVYSHTPAFFHPVAYPEGHNQWVVAIDDRPWGRYDPLSGAYKITNGQGHGFAVLRGKLNLFWLTNDKQIFRDISPMAMGLYASWLGENITKRFGLTPLEQLQITILAAYFYQSLFTVEEQFTDVELLRMCRSISGAVHCKPNDVETLLNMLNGRVIRNVDEFCATCYEVTETVRLKDFNTGLLFHVISGTWFGNGAEELCAIALEHPPTWLAILMAALTERTFKNSQIAKMAERRPLPQTKSMLQSIEAVLSTSY